MRLMQIIRSLLPAFLWGTLSALSTLAEGPGFSISMKDQVVVVHVGGMPFAEYVLNDPATNKTYLWPVYGPTGSPMTRAFPMKEVDGEVKDHYHHRGICFGHEDIAGADTWTERMTFDKGDKTSEGNKVRLAKIGIQKHKTVHQMAATERDATLVTELDYLNPRGERLFSELRTLVFRIDESHRIIDFHQEFSSNEGDVLFADKKDAGLSIRVPTSMSVDTRLGGKIVNSEGMIDAAAWGKRAKWCDYSGPVGKEKLGVTILNHPSSFRHPTTWHVRTYGLFTANPFGTLDPKSPNGPYTLSKGQKLVLKHRFLFHQGEADLEKISKAYDEYAKLK